MKKSTIKPNEITYNTLIDAMAKGNQWQKALHIFEEMKKSTIKPNEVTYNTLIKRNGFSELDLAGINQLYCQDTCYVDKRDPEDCEGWAEQHCDGEKFGDWMSENCARTCEVCTSGLPCKNREDDCDKWKGWGLCND